MLETLPPSSEQAAVSRSRPPSAVRPMDLAHQGPSAALPVVVSPTTVWCHERRGTGRHPPAAISETAFEICRVLNRRLAGDYGTSSAHAEPVIRWAITRVMVRRLTRGRPARRPGPATARTTARVDGAPPGRWASAWRAAGVLQSEEPLHLALEVRYQRSDPRRPGEVHTRARVTCSRSPDSWSVPRPADHPRPLTFRHRIQPQGLRCRRQEVGQALVLPYQQPYVLHCQLADRPTSKRLRGRHKASRVARRGRPTFVLQLLKGVVTVQGWVESPRGSSHAGSPTRSGPDVCVRACAPGSPGAQASRASTVDR